MTDTAITTAEAAAILGVTVSRVQQLIAAGLVTAQRRGRDWLIDRASVEAYKPGKRGWPAGVKRGARVNPPGP